MAFERNAIRFLVSCKRRGVDFTTCATLARQSTYGITRDELRRELNSVIDAPISLDAAGAMLEGGRYVEPILEMLGATSVVSIDNSPYESATRVHDLNDPIPDDLVKRFSFVIDGGTLEHTFNFPTALRNGMSMVAVGGHYMGMIPVNNFAGHGFYQFSPEVYAQALSPENGFEILDAVIVEHMSSSWFRVLSYGRGVKTAYPSLLFVLAKRHEDVPIFRKWPQQGAYVEEWSKKGAPREPLAAPAPSAAHAPAGLKQRAMRFVVSRPAVYRALYRAALPAVTLLGPRMNRAFRRVPRP